VAKVGSLGAGAHTQAFLRAQAGAHKLGIVSMRGLEVSGKLEHEPTKSISSGGQQAPREAWQRCGVV
jgi:hypothetical protein